MACQKADWERHERNCIPVMVTKFERMGRGVVAARDIKMADLQRNLFRNKIMYLLISV